MRTGVIQPLPGIGDMIWYLPAIKAIASAALDQKIILYARASVQAPALLSAEPLVSDFVTLPLKRRGFLSGLPNFFSTWQMLYRTKPDRLYILHQSRRYYYAAKLAGIRDIITYPQDLAFSKANGWEKSLAFLKVLGTPVSNPTSRLNVNVAAVEAMKGRYEGYPEPWIIVMPGAADNLRLWPAQRFSICIDHLIQKTQGTVFLVGRKNEAQHIVTIHSLSSQKDKIVTLTDLSFDYVMGLIASCKLLLGNDSGPANTAAALGVPAFALCGITEPPLHSPHLNLIRPDLSPEQAEGMARISAHHVMAILDEYLDKA